MGPVMTGGDALTGKTMIMITLRTNRTGRNIFGSQANYPPPTQLGWPKTFVLSNIQRGNSLMILIRPLEGIKNRSGVKAWVRQGY
jgi:hypothetical protein